MARIAILLNPLAGLEYNETIREAKKAGHLDTQGTRAEHHHDRRNNMKKYSLEDQLRGALARIILSGVPYDATHYLAAYVSTNGPSVAVFDYEPNGYVLERIQHDTVKREIVEKAAELAGLMKAAAEDEGDPQYIQALEFMAALGGEKTILISGQPGS